MYVCANGFVKRTPTVPSMVTEIPGVETRGFRAWPGVCASGTCCVSNEPGSCAEEAEDELLREVCATS